MDILLLNLAEYSSWKMERLLITFTLTEILPSCVKTRTANRNRHSVNSPIFLPNSQDIFTHCIVPLCPDTRCSSTAYQNCESNQTHPGVPFQKNTFVNCQLPVNSNSYFIPHCPLRCHNRHV